MMLRYDIRNGERNMTVLKVGHFAQLHRDSWLYFIVYLDLSCWLKLIHLCPHGEIQKSVFGVRVIMRTRQIYQFFLSFLFTYNLSGFYTVSPDPTLWHEYHIVYLQWVLHETVIIILLWWLIGTFYEYFWIIYA